MAESRQGSRPMRHGGGQRGWPMRLQAGGLSPNCWSRVEWLPKWVSGLGLRGWRLFFAFCDPFWVWWADESWVGDSLDKRFRVPTLAPTPIFSVLSKKKTNSSRDSTSDPILHALTNSVSKTSFLGACNPGSQTWTPPLFYFSLFLFLIFLLSPFFFPLPSLLRRCLTLAVGSAHRLSLHLRLHTRCQSPPPPIVSRISSVHLQGGRQ